MNRRNLLKTAACGAASLALHGCTGPAKKTTPSAAEKPNIIFIIVDDLGWADLPCYGGKSIQTPNIDRMAAEGIRFTNAYSGCTVCAPARSVLMSGLHMGHTPVRGNTGGIPIRDQDVTVAEVLKHAGYATGGFGKWGLGDVRTPGVPEKQGFDTFFGYYHQVHAHYYWPEYLWSNSRTVPVLGEKGSAEGYTHYRIFAEMLRFIRTNKDRPFFCYAPWTPPHGRYEIPESDPAWKIYKDKPWPQMAKVVAAMVSMIDRHVGRLFKLLSELDIDRRTIVFFCSDNGAAARFEGTLDSCGPLRGFKRSMYEGGIRVPFITRWPGRIPKGAVSDLPCYFADMMPTFAEIAGATQYLPDNIDGLSILPTLTANPNEQKKHRFMYWEWQLYNWGKKQNIPNRLMQAVRMGKWKAVRHRSDVPFELYDLSSDIGEKNNLAADHPEIVRKIEAYIKRTRTEPPPQIEPPKPEAKRYR